MNAIRLRSCQPMLLVLLLWLLACSDTPTAPAASVPLTHGPIEPIADHRTLVDAGLLAYADGSAGGYIRDTAGQLWNANFMASEQAGFVPVTGAQFDFAGARIVPVRALPRGYAGSGGPIVDLGRGVGCMVLHLEGAYYQKLAAAKVVMGHAGPLSVTYVGDLITPQWTASQAQAQATVTASAGSGVLLEVDPWVYTYFAEYPAAQAGSVVTYGVARALRGSVAAALAADQAPVFAKFDGQGWSESGLGGLGFDIGLDSPRGNGDFMTLADGRHLWLTTDSPGITSWRIAYSVTRDALRFAPWRYLDVTSTSAEWVYATTYSGDPGNPRRATGPEFQFIWTRAQSAATRWDANDIVRLTIRPGTLE